MSEHTFKFGPAKQLGRAFTIPMRLQICCQCRDDLGLVPQQWQIEKFHDCGLPCFVEGCNNTAELQYSITARFFADK
ncbi:MULTISPECIES: hypothetical protein [Gammaproteobacteria]|uniref:hypothetical protein n=1 Tax=Gammaproteobacteria TaxID=1236 RepID=UPI00111561BC|nr:MULTISPECIES: hypothetical protein [Gammaproteobacteria]